MAVQDTHPAPTLYALHTQARVIVALTVLGMQEEAGESRLGYLSTFVQPIVFITVFMIVHIFVRSLSPPGMPAVMFTVLGVIPYYTFMYTQKAVVKSPKIAKSLVMLPRVTTLDVIVSQCLSEFCSGSILFVVVISFSLVFTHAALPYNFLGVVIAFYSAWLLGCGFGLILLAAHRIFPGLSNFSIVINRVGLLTSGLFFVIGQLPRETWVYFTWNPLLHINEFTRSCWFPIYQSPIASAAYVAECILGVLLFGLIFERSTRRIGR